jgi:hypothetical protein
LSGWVKGQVNVRVTLSACLKAIMLTHSVTSSGL